MNVDKEEGEEEDDVLKLDSFNSRNIQSSEIPGSSGAC